MVSFSCEACGDVLTKKKLDPHRNQCRGASFTCLDCMVHFHGVDYRSHTACISEAQKYQGHLYREKDSKKAQKGEKRKSLSSHQRDDYNSHADTSMVPLKAYVEDVPEDGDGTVAIIDVPPKAPTPPPPSTALPESVNVFDFLVTEDPSNGNTHINAVPAPSQKKMISESRNQRHPQHSPYPSGNGTAFDGAYSYGNNPIQPGFERFDSWPHFPGESQHAQEEHKMAPPPPYLTKIVTPAPDRARSHVKDDKSDKKRKRHQVEDLDLSSTKRPASRDEPMTDAPPSRVLHSGLTGGLTRLVTDSSFYDDRIDAGPTPISPVKRSKRDKSRGDAGKRKSSYETTRSYELVKIPTGRQSVEPEEVRRHRRRESDYYDDRSRASRRPRSPSSISLENTPSTRRLSKVKAIDYPPNSSRPSSVQPTASNQLVSYHSRAELFMSFVTKGPDSERGCSINKALKRYHRELDVKSGGEKEEEDKELWKNLRLRKNDRGEIVLFMA